jgi:ring-1,2-phenylacetyl-CoA epoxidase subunit PaaD
MVTTSKAWEVLRRVPDPEIPVISVTDLGIVRDVVANEDCVEVIVTPTYAGCPATEVIRASIEEALRAAGAVSVQIRTRLDPPWTTDWIAPAARKRLREYGIAPPHALPLDEQPILFAPRRLPVECPLCRSDDTERLSQFGATACKALYRCRSCREPFEYFKPL